MYLRSDSFKPYDYLDSRLAFGKHHETDHFQFAENKNPHLAWSDVPEGTKSFALLCYDPDVPSVGTDVNQEGKTVPLDLQRVDFFHWVVANLPADLLEIAEGSHSDGVTAAGKAPGPSPSGGLQGINDYTGWFAGHEQMGGNYGGYDGPAPPWNDERVHGYRFMVCALDAVLDLEGTFTGQDLIEAMGPHILDRAELIGLYAINPDARQK
ncbi:MAG: YbhB/YbcL family Raf kinase inhibitor-like protein [Deltaproteobacteria bacterium]|nr:YbhB/YbcL family Raf kinase inhibitor-like protein [Deltaproteobacteria bacterium]